MANDILNTANGTTGNQVQGTVRVFQPGRPTVGNGHTYSPADEETSTVASIAAKYDTRFDDPRYYTGDAIT